MQKKLESISSGKKTNWAEKARWRKENRSWLRKSASIAMQILDELESKGWSQKYFAEEKLKVSPQYVSKMVSGEENFGLKTIDDIERAMNIRINNSPIKLYVDYQERLTYSVYNAHKKSKHQIKKELIFMVDIGADENAPIYYSNIVPTAIEAFS